MEETAQEHVVEVKKNRAQRRHEMKTHTIPARGSRVAVARAVKRAKKPSK